MKSYFHKQIFIKQHRPTIVDRKGRIVFIDHIETSAKVLINASKKYGVSTGELCVLVGEVFVRTFEKRHIGEELDVENRIKLKLKVAIIDQEIDLTLVIKLEREGLTCFFRTFVAF